MVQIKLTAGRVLVLIQVAFASLRQDKHTPLSNETKHNKIFETTKHKTMAKFGVVRKLATIPQSLAIVAFLCFAVVFLSVTFLHL